MRAVIVDTDMASDDWMAIAYLIKHPETQVKAITIVGTGQCHCEPGIANALQLLDMVNHTEIPVTCGQTTPLKGERVFPQGWRDDSDAFYGLRGKQTQPPTLSHDAIETMIALLDSQPHTIITMGPLTNIAGVFLQRPDLVAQVEHIYIMGGALFVEGSAPNHAEWNLYVDPYAAQVVFESGAPVTLIPLDATQHLPITRDFYEHLNGAAVTPEAFFIYEVLTWQYNVMQRGELYFWDPCAATIMTDNSLATFETYRLRMDEDSGRVVIDEEGGAPVRVALSADREGFERLFLETMNR